MTKNLVAIGNSLGIIIEKPILDLLGIGRDTELRIRTDGHRLVIEPVTGDENLEQVRSITRKLIKTHDKTFRKLAE